MHQPLRARIYSALAFILALLISLPSTGLKYVVVSNRGELSESDKWKYHRDGGCDYKFEVNQDFVKSNLWTAYVWAYEVVVRFGPALIMAVLNVLIMLKFHKVVRNRVRMKTNAPRDKGQPASRHLDQERKLMTLLISITVLFFVTNTPSAILSIIYHRKLEDSWSFQIFRVVASLLEISNYALNFCMYFLCSKEFRRCIREVFPGCPVVFSVPPETTQSNTSGSTPVTRSEPLTT